MDSRHVAAVSARRLLCGTGGVTNESFYGLNLFKYFFGSVWSATIRGTLKSQLNTPGQEIRCLQDSSYNGRLLCNKWSKLNVESTIETDVF
jgi:hypothetical protein